MFDRIVESFSADKLPSMTAQAAVRQLSWQIARLDVWLSHENPLFVTRALELTSSTTAARERTGLERVSDYIISKLAVAGISARLMSNGTSGSGVATEFPIDVATHKPWTLWVRVHQCGFFEGKVEILGFSEPFELESLIEVGPSVIGRILMHCDVQSS